MNGDFKTDITRDTFRLHKHYSRVLMQQGRVQLDSDWNEQVDIFLHYLRTFIADVIGPHGCFDDGFKVEKYTRIEQVQDTRARKTKQKSSDTARTSDVPYHFLIGRGHYYVHGILCENDRHEHVFSIPPFMRPTAQSNSDEEKDESQASYCIYLDVWEREVTYLEDPLIREVALGGPDTTTRSEVVCKICAVKVEDAGENAPDRDDSKYLDEKSEFQLSRFAGDWTTHLQSWKESDHGYLQAETVDVEQSSKEPCTVPPSSQYRGMENQLYRIEIHDGGEPVFATFKWSRENGAVMFPIINSLADIGGQPQTSLVLTLGNLGRDDSRFGLNVDDWVEIVDVGEAEEVEEEPGPLMRVQSVEHASRQVTLVSDNGITLDADPESILFLRRWDYHAGDPADRHTPKIAKSGALEIVPGWLTLEDGIQIQFLSDKATTFRTGDYWLIPARTAYGTIEWPRHNNQADRLPPHGVKHYYAPLCHVKLTGGKIAQDSDLLHLRRVIGRP
jgi:hypothetical protein